MRARARGRGNAQEDTSPGLEGFRRTSFREQEKEDTRKAKACPGLEGTWRESGCESRLGFLGDDLVCWACELRSDSPGEGDSTTAAECHRVGTLGGTE